MRSTRATWAACWVLGLGPALAAAGCAAGPEETRDRGAEPSAEAIASTDIPGLREPGPTGRLLRTGEVQRASVAPERPLTYTLKLLPGEFALVEVDQGEVDVEVEIVDPGGQPLLRFDLPVERKMPERVCFVGRTAGPHAIRLAPFRDARGDLALHVVRKRPATREDRRCAEAAQGFMAAESRRRDERPSPGLAAAYEEAQERWLEGGEPALAAIALRQAGNQWLVLGRSQEAARCFRRGLSQARAARSAYSEANLLNRLATALLDQGDAAGAAEAAGEALDLSGSASLPEEEATSLYLLGQVEVTTGETHRGIERYRQALRLWTELGRDAEAARNLVALGEAYSLLDHHEDALRLLGEALAVARRSGGADRVAEALTHLGWVHRLRGRPQEAIAPLREAVELWRRQGNLSGETGALDRLATALQEAGEVAPAIDSYEQALALAEQAGNARKAILILANLGCLHQKLGRLDEAWSQLSAARDRFQALDDPKARSQVEFCLARTEEQRGHHDSAIRHMEEALEIVDALRGTARSRGQLYSPIWLWQDYSESYVELLLARHRATGRIEDLARAFEAGDLARARNLFDSVLESRVGVRASAEAALLERERDVQKRLNAADSTRRRLLESDSAPAEELAGLDRRLAELSLELEEVRASIRASDPRYAELAAPRPTTLAELQRHLDRKTAVLSYSVGATRSSLLVITREAATPWDLPSREKLEAQVGALYESLCDSRQELHQHRLVARDLARLVLPEGAIPQGVERLLVIADGPLHYLPFVVLPVTGPGSDGPGERLVLDAFEVSYLPSASVFATLRRRDAGRSRPPRTLAVFADPVFSPDDERLTGPAAAGQPRPALERAAPLSAERLPAGPLPRLPATRTEARDILALVPAQQRLAALDFDASKQAVLSEDLHLYQILHLATHAFIDERFPELSGLVLSRFGAAGQEVDGDLHLHEIYGLRLAADLVVLSGCQTALGQQVRGDGLLGLTRGFLYAGSSRLLVSLWSVNDAATAALMAELYRGMLERGESPAAALRNAQQSIRRQDRWQAPYYWAAFVLQGDAG